MNFKIQNRGIEAIDIYVHECGVRGATTSIPKTMTFGANRVSLKEKATF
jgi:hypothetical protein